MGRHHYLGRPDMVWQVLCYVATVDGKWVALWGWASAAWQRSAVPDLARDHRSAFR